MLISARSRREIRPAWERKVDVNAIIGRPIATREGSHGKLGAGHLSAVPSVCGRILGRKTLTPGQPEQQQRDLQCVQEIHRRCVLGIVFMMNDRGQRQESILQHDLVMTKSRIVGTADVEYVVVLFYYTTLTQSRGNTWIILHVDANLSSKYSEKIGENHNDQGRDHHLSGILWADQTWSS